MVQKLNVSFSLEILITFPPPHKHSPVSPCLTGNRDSLFTGSTSYLPEQCETSNKTISKKTSSYRNDFNFHFIFFFMIFSNSEKHNRECGNLFILNFEGKCIITGLLCRTVNSQPFIWFLPFKLFFGTQQMNGFNLCFIQVFQRFNCKWISRPHQGYCI